MASWKETLNLPDTAFPMKANLVQREPEILARWQGEDLYGKIRAARRGAEVYAFHDGPPYANGDIHVGQARNKILKDATVRYRTMRGLDAPFIPGWDCHGLPIEHNVMKELGEKARSTPPADVRRLCRAYAEKYVDLQRASFKRFGVSADWDRPYLTMSPAYEAGILDVFADLVAGGYVTRGLRAIHWCVTCRTALAEAELEYGPETSPSIHVRFAVEPESLAVLGGARTSVVIWTTTPWTLPANVAVAVNPKLQYAVVEHDGPDGAQRVVVALALVEKYVAAVGATDHAIPLVVSGEALRGVRLRHPFLDRVVPVVGADYVSADDGTGCVHTAPGHGADDFQTGKREGLPILCPVGPDGIYTADVGAPWLVGTHVFKADEIVVQQLRDRGALAAFAKLEHSYPHCWRCKKKVIFRATDQWFIAVDHEGLRQRALDACKTVNWVPAATVHRIVGMLRDRPDWCISRQRTWGVPIPAFYCDACGKVHCTAELVRHVRERFAKDGADAWFTTPAADLLPAGFACGCGSAGLRKETDIFDVWFESGSSWRSVCTPERGMKFPADAYLEGHDQHRGWFQSSLLPAVATKGEPPYTTCVTHGFFNDEQGEKVSKSKGGMKELTPERLFSQVGADITRLFFLNGAYFDDVSISMGLIAPAGDQYRKIRNTLRFLLGGVAGFDPATDALPSAEMLAIDRWAVAAMDEATAQVTEGYEGFDYSRAAQTLRGFMDADLSAFYLDLVKDRLYCAPTDSREYRSCRTALAHLASALIRLWAPLLPFTTEEAWGFLPEALRKDASVHLAPWPTSSGSGPSDAAAVAPMRAARALIQQHADAQRKSGAIGSSGEIAAHVHEASAGKLSFGDSEEELLEVLGVAELVRRDEPSGALIVGVAKTTLPRCERCRRHRPDAAVRGDGRDPLCTRCEAWRAQEPPAA